MTLKDIAVMLEGVNGLDGKVAYRAFPANQAPPLPFVCYMDTETQNFFADNKVYQIVQGIDIELYSAIKDISIETSVEEALSSNNITWNKYETYIPDEKMYETVYSITIDQ